MTGKELILYILKNNLEDEVIFQNGTFTGFMSTQEVANKFNVGLETINIWVRLGWIEGINIGGSMYFLRDVADPRNTIETLY